MPSAQSIRWSAEVIRDASALIFTAGAGMGVDSGLPDFRGKEGFWKAYPPMKHLGRDLPSMSNPRWFDKDPALAWGFFGHRYHLYSKTKPHDGFRILFEWGKAKPLKYFVFTSNVDGHFQKAGFDEDRIVECHGSINWLQCSHMERQRCKRKYRDAPVWPASDDKQLAALKVDPDTFRASDPLPMCMYGCGKPARPNILMFGDYSWEDDRHEVQDNGMNEYLSEVVDSGEKVVVIELGAGLAVPTVRMQSEDIVTASRVVLIRINTTDTTVPSDGMDAISLPLGALEALRLIDEELQTLR